VAGVRPVLAPDVGTHAGAEPQGCGRAELRSSQTPDGTGHTGLCRPLATPNCHAKSGAVGPLCCSPGDVAHKPSSQTSPCTGWQHRGGWRWAPRGLLRRQCFCLGLCSTCTHVRRSPRALCLASSWPEPSVAWPLPIIQSLTPGLPPIPQGDIMSCPSPPLSSHANKYVQMCAHAGTSVGVGFAIPGDMVTRIVPQLISNGRVVRPSLGIQVRPAYHMCLLASLLACLPGCLPTCLLSCVLVCLSPPGCCAPSAHCVCSMRHRVACLSPPGCCAC